MDRLRSWLSFLLLIPFIFDCSRQTQVSDGFPVPDYFIESIKNEEVLINEAINSSEDNVSFLFFTDAHWGDNQKNSPAIISHIVKNTGINDVVFGGDVITQRFADKDEAIALGESFRSAFDSLKCNMYYLFGNHDDNSDAQPELSERHLSEQQVYDYLQKGMGECVYGNYYNFYFDRASSKTRFICLDTGRYYYSQFRNHLPETASFLINTLNSIPEGWRTVVISHIWYEWSSDNLYLPEYSQLLISVLDDFNQKKNGSFVYGSEVIPYDFSGVSSEVICCIGGHCHVDATFRSEGGIPVVLTTTDSMQTTNGDVAISGSISEQSVSAFVVDYSNRKLQMFRIGRGSDLTILF